MMLVFAPHGWCLRMGVLVGLQHCAEDPCVSHRWSPTAHAPAQSNPTAGACVLHVERILQHANTHTSHLVCHPPAAGSWVMCVCQVGQKREFGFPVKDHVALAEALDMVDFDTASEVGLVVGWGASPWHCTCTWCRTVMLACHSVQQSCDAADLDVPTRKCRDPAAGCRTLRQRTSHSTPSMSVFATI